MLHLLKETLDGVHLSSMDVPFVVVDLGCSCGSNTIYIVDVIIKHIIKRFEALAVDPPEFTAFFSDLPGNDFNTLFQLLPPLASYGSSMEECLAADNHRSYFAAGVPGSFYRRLFPARSIDVFHSAFSLHWLSQVFHNICVLFKFHNFRLNIIIIIIYFWYLHGIKKLKFFIFLFLVKFNFYSKFFKFLII